MGVLSLAVSPSARAAAEDIDSTGIAWLVEQEIARGDIPGAVVLIGDRDRILYEHAFGFQALSPRPEPMTVDTGFDLASLTKVVATTPAILQLIEQGKMALDAPVSRYWPGFAARGKSAITVRELLTHTSGLPPDLSLGSWTGRRAALRQVVEQRPVAPPGTRYIYSDINFIALGELVRRVSGLPLDVYCERHIFRPLGMWHTEFMPAASLRAAIAPTEIFAGRLLRGEVQDPTAARMGGVAGHAGLFAPAGDLARYAQALLRGGAIGPPRAGRHLLTRASLRLMTQPDRVAIDRFRGLGWDLMAPFVGNRSSLPPFGAFGHLGYTGTALWIDPTRDLFVVVLTSRLYPHGRGNAQPLRRGIADLLSVDSSTSMTSIAAAADPPLPPGSGYIGQQVQTGADVLAADHFAELRGLRVGLVTNQTGLTSGGERLIDELHQAPGLRLVALFSPEHGLQGRVDERVGDSIDAATGLPVFSLYGTVKRPTDAMLQGLDALVFDVQDSGTRFFTYVTTMAYAMQAAARHGLRFFVLDRPDPIDAAIVQGPVLDEDLRSFTGFYPMPLRPGMTVGEIARLFNTQADIGARLTVIGMRGYRRGVWLDETGLPWTRPSPNLRSLEEETLYPGVGMVEGANVSVGRGTEMPFQLLGAPWIDGPKLAGYLARREIPGVRFTPVSFVPAQNRFQGERCQGARILLVDRESLRSGLLGVELIGALQRLYPQRFRIDGTLSLVGSRRVLAAIEAGEDPRVIAASWQPRLATFMRLRNAYLLYPPGLRQVGPLVGRSLTAPPRGAPRGVELDR
jgi:uncharacterized protein YbbC (DUF1343 family)/CubicO group peptidase (beta-lactamase class C family)